MILGLSPIERDALMRVHRAFRVSLDPLVIAGGWAARLLRLHGLATSVPFPAIGTKDLDVAVTDRPQARGQQLALALKAEGFRPD